MVLHSFSTLISTHPSHLTPAPFSSSINKTFRPRQHWAPENQTSVIYRLPSSRYETCTEKSYHVFLYSSGISFAEPSLLPSESSTAEFNISDLLHRKPLGSKLSHHRTPFCTTTTILCLYWKAFHRLITLSNRPRLEHYTVEQTEVSSHFSVLQLPEGCTVMPIAQTHFFWALKTILCLYWAVLRCLAALLNHAAWTWHGMCAARWFTCPSARVTGMPYTQIGSSKTHPFEHQLTFCACLENGCTAWPNCQSPHAWKRPSTDEPRLLKFHPAPAMKNSFLYTCCLLSYYISYAQLMA